MAWILQWIWGPGSHWFGERTVDDSVYEQHGQPVRLQAFGDGLRHKLDGAGGQAVMAIPGGRTLPYLRPGIVPDDRPGGYWLGDRAHNTAYITVACGPVAPLELEPDYVSWAPAEHLQDGWWADYIDGPPRPIDGSQWTGDVFGIPPIN